ncbi:MAG: hypothetical protein AVDCRST_MAG06-309 [uncultured Nocardioides sp.]|uniref:Uncharacterized protein n=1 Tax=uncultured Nocardioides sp. TaxID=198441 RepID=A0A6J4N5T9_9ACTN|nr:MAG: hypothetical protein AVDCRST_MAG06-309 [uncultured Nocardioides sp.]
MDSTDTHKSYSGRRTGLCWNIPPGGMRSAGRNHLPERGTP